MITRLAHVCLKVASLDKSMDFYHKTLGLPIKFTFMKAGMAIGFYLEVGPGNFIEIFQGGESDPPNTRISHFCFETDDMDGFIEQMRGKGIVCTKKSLGSDGAWQTWLQDPDGNHFELHEYTTKSAQITGGIVLATW